MPQAIALIVGRLATSPVPIWTANSIVAATPDKKDLRPSPTARVTIAGQAIKSIDRINEFFGIVNRSILGIANRGLCAQPAGQIVSARTPVTDTKVDLWAVAGQPLDASRSGDQAPTAQQLPPSSSSAKKLNREFRRRRGRRMSATKRLALIAIGYAFCVAGGLAADAVNELLMPADIAQTSPGMVAFGDTDPVRADRRVPRPRANLVAEAVRREGAARCWAPSS